jgi:hypothetical protein
MEHWQGSVGWLSVGRTVFWGFFSHNRSFWVVENFQRTSGFLKEPVKKISNSGVSSLMGPLIFLKKIIDQGSIYLTLTHRLFLCKRGNHTTLVTISDLSPELIKAFICSEFTFTFTTLFLIKKISQKWLKSDECPTWLTVNLDKPISTRPFWLGHFNRVILIWSF